MFITSSYRTTPPKSLRYGIISRHYRAAVIRCKAKSEHLVPCHFTQCCFSIREEYRVAAGRFAHTYDDWRVMIPAKLHISVTIKF
jgi:hypothetical protein